MLYGIVIGNNGHHVRRVSTMVEFVTKKEAVLEIAKSRRARELSQRSCPSVAFLRKKHTVLAAPIIDAGNARG